MRFGPEKDTYRSYNYSSIAVILWRGRGWPTEPKRCVSSIARGTIDVMNHLKQEYTTSGYIMRIDIDLVTKNAKTTTKHTKTIQNHLKPGSFGSKIHTYETVQNSPGHTWWPCRTSMILEVNSACCPKLACPTIYHDKTETNTCCIQTISVGFNMFQI